MSKSKELIASASAKTPELAIAKPIKLAKEAKKTLLLLSVGFPSAISIGSIPFAVSASDISLFYVSCAMGWFAGVTSGMMNYSMEKEVTVNRAFAVGNEHALIPWSSHIKSMKKRVLISSFHLKETTDLELDSWQDSKNAVPEHEATHTVRQYLRRTRKGPVVEQEIIANPETIWDLSADALVEVYKVQEKTDFMKRITA